MFNAKSCKTKALFSTYKNIIDNFVNKSKVDTFVKKCRIGIPFKRRSESREQLNPLIFLDLFIILIGNRINNTQTFRVRLWTGSSQLHTV